MTKSLHALRAVAVVLLVGAVATLTFGSPAEPTVDGQIGASEYQFHYFDEDINMDVYWTVTDEDLYIAVKAPATGWVSVGFRPGVPTEEEEAKMEGVDFLIGYVQGGQAFARDDYGDTPFTHKADTELGGQDNIEAFAGSEANGTTIFEFKRALNTKDEFDAVIPVLGEVYLAYSNADDFTTIHTERTEVEINFATGFAEKEEHEE